MEKVCPVKCSFYVAYYTVSQIKGTAGFTLLLVDGKIINNGLSYLRSLPNRDLSTIDYCICMRHCIIKWSTYGYMLSANVF